MKYLQTVKCPYRTGVLEFYLKLAEKLHYCFMTGVLSFAAGRANRLLGMAKMKKNRLNFRFPGSWTESPICRIVGE